MSYSFIASGFISKSFFLSLVMKSFVEVLIALILYIFCISICLTHNLPLLSLIVFLDYIIHDHISKKWRFYFFLIFIITLSFSLKLFGKNKLVKSTKQLFINIKSINLIQKYKKIIKSYAWIPNMFDILFLYQEIS